MDIQYDVIIVGAGPAGMTAAIYASRSGLKTAMLEKAAPGGKMIKTYEIQNWPGIKETSGADLAYQMFEHSTHFGAEYLYGDVVEIKTNDGIEIFCADGTVYQSKAVIVATGTQERLLNIQGEKEYTGMGVSYCAVCDGSFFKNKAVAVIGGGNSALEEALYLTQFASEVHVVIRRDVFRAEPIIQKQIEENSKIKIIKKHIPKEIIGKEGKVCAILLEDVESKQKQTLSVSAVFPYVGADPCTEFVQQLKICDKHNYIIVNDKMETSVPGIYGIGDVIVKNLRQVVTAAGDGAIAAQQVFHYIQTKKK